MLIALVVVGVELVVVDEVEEEVEEEVEIEEEEVEETLVEVAEVDVDVLKTQCQNNQLSSKVKYIHKVAETLVEVADDEAELGDELEDEVVRGVDVVKVGKSPDGSAIEIAGMLMVGRSPSNIPPLVVVAVEELPPSLHDDDRVKFCTVTGFFSTRKGTYNIPLSTIQMRYSVPRTCSDNIEERDSQLPRSRLCAIARAFRLCIMRTQP